MVAARDSISSPSRLSFLQVEGRETPTDEIILDFIGEHVLRVADGQRSIERMLVVMLGRLQSLDNNVVDVRCEIGHLL